MKYEHFKVQRFFATSRVDRDEFHESCEKIDWYAGCDTYTIDVTDEEKAFFALSVAQPERFRPDPHSSAYWAWNHGKDYYWW